MRVLLKAPRAACARGLEPRSGRRVLGLSLSGQRAKARSCSCSPSRPLGPSGARRTGERRTTRRSVAVLGCWLGCWAVPHCRRGCWAGRTAWLLGAWADRAVRRCRGCCLLACWARAVPHRTRTAAAAPLLGLGACCLLAAGRCWLVAARALGERAGLRLPIPD